jgi:hypothetical protein
MTTHEINPDELIENYARVVMELGRAIKEAEELRRQNRRLSEWQEVQEPILSRLKKLGVVSQCEKCLNYYYDYCEHCEYVGQLAELDLHR